MKGYSWEIAVTVSLGESCGLKWGLHNQKNVMQTLAAKKTWAMFGEAFPKFMETEDFKHITHYYDSL